MIKNLKKILSCGYFYLMLLIGPKWNVEKPVGRCLAHWIKISANSMLKYFSCFFLEIGFDSLFSLYTKGVGFNISSRLSL